MAYITKRGNSYSVRYTYEDEHGKSCDKWESFPTKEEATNRKKQIEHELAAGTFLIPSSVTVAEFLMDWLPKQCSKHKWAPKTYESNLSTIQNLIIPYIGSMEMQKLKPYHMENLYTTLSKTPCGSYIEGKKQELTEKQKQRFLSGTTIHEVHRLLGTAFQYAVEWGILVKSPVPVDSPKKSTQERTIWTVEEMRAALDSMEDPILHLAVHLTLVGALREGEIVGLTPEDLDFDAADGIGTFRINKSMQRVRKEALNQVDDGCIIKIFPDKLERSTTSLILKSTKTASSCRTIFMTSALKEELKKWLNQLAADEMKDPARYHDSGMLFRLPNGLAVEPVLIRKKFLKWQDAHPEFPRIVFHGLRHSSATYQLMISGGDVKAVQGTTGHATADMLVNTYAHIQQSSRVELGRKFEEGFYAKSENPSPQAVPAEGEPTISMTALLELLKNADPEVKAQRRLGSADFGVCIFQQFQQSSHRNGRFAFGGYSLRAGVFGLSIETFLELPAQLYTGGLLDMGVGVHQHICRSVSCGALNGLHIAAGDHQLIGGTGMPQTVEHNAGEFRVGILPFEELLADQHRLHCQTIG